MASLLYNNYKTCRTCLGKDTPGNIISFKKKVNFVKLQTLIKDTTGVMLDKNDGFPYHICDLCIYKAEAAQAFREKAMECSACIESNGTPPPDINDYDKMEVIAESQDLPGVSLSTGDNDCIPIESFFNLDSDISQSNQLAEKELQKAYCPLCLVSFDNDTQLTKHMWTIHPEVMGNKKRGRPKKLDSKEVCRRLTQYYELETVNNTEVECTLCHETIARSLYMEHWKKHLDEEAYGCVNCTNVYLERGSYKCCPKNMTSFTVVDNDTKCILNVALLKEYLNDSNSSNVAHGCFVCSAIFPAVDKLLIHHESQHPTLSHRCNLCYKEFSSLKNARRHRESCKSSERKFACPVCTLKFAFEVSLNKHILRHHSGQEVSVQFLDISVRHKNKKFLCLLCRRLFSRQDLLDKHSRTHLPEPEEYKCHACEHKFSTAKSLRDHIKEHDPEASERRNLCLYCGRNFSNSSNLIVHMRRHTGDNPYKCDFCSKSFPRSSDLQCHRRTHTGERPCVCTICGKAFSRSNKLARHMRVHTGQRPYKCVFCGKSFSQSNDLKLHIRRHTGEKPYICEVCGERYIQGTALQQHQRTHGHFYCNPKPGTSYNLAHTTPVPQKSVQEPISQTPANSDFSCGTIG